MSLRVNQNVLSLQTYSNLTKTSSRLEKSIQKLSSGMRINSAADDVAGLAISEKMRRQIRGLNRAALNAQDGISMIQTAEGALNESQSIVQRMRELAIQASNDTLTSNDRLEIQKEVSQLRSEIDRISTSTEFNTKKLLDGTQSALISSSSRSAGGIVTGDTNGTGTFKVSMALVNAGISQMQRSQIFTKTDGSGLAGGGTRLEDIAQFYNSEGVFVLDSSQTITLNGNSRESAVTIDSKMTLDQLAGTLQQAFAGKSGLGVSNSTAGVIGTAQTNLSGLGGYLQLVSGAVGDEGKFSVAGPQSVVDALGFGVSRNAVNSQIEVTLTDNGGNVRRTTTSSDRATGLLDGIDIQFASQSAQIAGVGGLSSGLRFTADQTFSIEAGGVAAVAVTLDAGDWSMEGLARAVNAQTQAISGLETMVVDGELRFVFESTDPATASTLEITLADADVIGVLDGQHSGFYQATKDLGSTVQGFSMYREVAAYVVGFDVGDGVNNHVFTAFTTISVADAADFQEMNDFQSTVNGLLEDNDVGVRLDAVGGSLAFTANRVGRENVDGADPVRSRVNLSIDDAQTLSDFGLRNGAATGSGDTNFRIHVVDNKPQFQIGADRGQNMQISMKDVSARALGIDKLDMSNVEGAQSALSRLNKALDVLSGERSKLGAYQNRLEYSLTNIRNAATNLTSAESRIRDADIAMEMIEFTRNQIVSQAGTAMLAQANMIPQSVLSLLGQ